MVYQKNHRGFTLPVNRKNLIQLIEGSSPIYDVTDHFEIAELHLSIIFYFNIAKLVYQLHMENGEDGVDNCWYSIQIT